MNDTISKDRRSNNMRRIKSKGTKPEMAVRSLVYRLGYRYRLHKAELPGKPDIVFRQRRKVIFVHGCFWHGHKALNCVDGQRKPRSNREYWLPKLAGNEARDTNAQEKLRDMGWAVLVVWECETHDLAELGERLTMFLGE